ncbi:putative 2OG-Fe(II) oxygenase [Methylobacterium durans]|uniref:putative 2OG-Fe(II) oxygenase n=1 Tax=Methylobacterium durans TaxID=2202825 RepID=UPI002AFECBE2|nr:putative 2OG-Fe(II) oxygenase [Methylobacterium durans]MEA1833152.1 putative 2OG-Fe(II) oxygenase [Methylobacterium durans]
MTGGTDEVHRREAAHKRRALRKYEAALAPPGRDGGEPPLEMFSPFGPMIGRTRVSADLLAHLNAFADGEAASGGREFLVPPSVACAGGASALVAVIEDRLRRYVLAAEGVPAKRIVIDRIWIVSQFAATPSPVHFHSGDLSGVLYLKAPEPPPESELDRTYISGRQAGYLNFLTGGKQRFARTLLSVPPETGVLYTFPGWLLHGVEPFTGPGERRSLSFNASAEAEA